MVRSKITISDAIYGGLNNTNLYLINHLKYTLLNANPSANCGKPVEKCCLIVIILYTNILHSNHI